MGSEQLITIAQTARKFPIFTEAAVRSLIYRADKNGLANAVRRIAGRLYIDESAFQAWIDCGAVNASRDKANE